VYLTLPENGVIKVQPLIVAVLLEHLLKKTFLLLALIALIAEYQKDSGYCKTIGHENNLLGTKECVE
jgi:hypothetical protein